ncbi:MAG TPA: hypothetical protein PLB02_13850, partial [Thermoanaerobaculia bacterium]|nr:hypothetical protein [Thermoanaerobaculia bacterium]
MTDETQRADQIIETVQDPMILVKLGIQAAKEERWSDGASILAAAYERLTKRTEIKSMEAIAPGSTASLKDVVPGNALSYYGLCLAHSQGNYQEGAKFIHIAIHNEPMVGEHYLVLAKLWRHVRNRRKMVDAIQRGFEASPRYLPLRKLAQEVGLRKDPVLPFLSRDNTLNQALGRLRSKMERKRLEREIALEEERIAALRPKGRRPSTAGRPAPAGRSASGVRPA